MSLWERYADLPPDQAIAWAALVAGTLLVCLLAAAVAPDGLFDRVTNQIWGKDNGARD